MPVLLRVWLLYRQRRRTIKDREGEWVTIKLWGRGPAQNNNAVIQYQKREFDNAEGLVGVVPGFQDPVGEMGSLHATPSVKRMPLRHGGNGKLATNGSTLVRPNRSSDEPLEVGIYAGICDGKGKQIAQFEYFEDLLVPFDVSPRGKIADRLGRLETQA